MTSLATTVIVIGVLFGIAGWLASPTGSARVTRRAIAPALREYPAYVYAGLAVIVGLYFLSAPVQNLRSFLTTLVVAGLAAFGINELRRQSTEENPDASYDDLIGKTKDKMADAVDAVKKSDLGERASKLKEGLPEVRMPGRDDGEAEGTGNGGGGAERAVAGGNGHDARLERLERLGEMHQKGVLTKAEFDAEKKRVLDADD
jgi:hypothetical protein